MMPYLSGVLTGVLLTILVVFLIDHAGSDSGDIVNWNVVSAKLGSSFAQVKEEVRQEVHEATEPAANEGSTGPGTGGPN